MKENYSAVPWKTTKDQLLGVIYLRELGIYIYIYIYRVNLTDSIWYKQNRQKSFRKTAFLKFNDVLLQNNFLSNVIIRFQICIQFHTRFFC